MGMTNQQLILGVEDREQCKTTKHQTVKGMIIDDECYKGTLEDTTSFPMWPLSLNTTVFHILFCMLAAVFLKL